MSDESRKEYLKNYYLKNKERIKQYYQDNKEDILEKRREYRKKNSGKIKQYYNDHKEHYRQLEKEWAQNHKEYYKDKNSKYYQTPEGRAANLLHCYNRDDKNRGFDVSENITRDWIVLNILNGQSCVYCGESDWTKLGADRIDNSKPHTPDNVVCCCGKCNNERGTKYSFEEFKKIKGR